MENFLLANAIASYRAGDLTMARSVLEVELRIHPEGEEAWLWMSRLAAQPEERVSCLRRVLALNPVHREALASLLLATRSTPQRELPPPVPGNPPLAMTIRPDEIATAHKPRLAMTARQEEVHAAHGPLPPLPPRPLPVEPSPPQTPAAVDGVHAAGTPRRVRWRVRGVIAFVALAAAVLFFIVMALATVPMFAGNRTLAVLGGSMEPAIDIGSAVVAQPVPSQDLKVGDVIVFSPGPQVALPLVHRIVEIRERGGVKYYTTRGDANRTGDVDEVSLPQTAWRVWYAVPWAGYVISFASGSAGRLLLVLLPLGALLLVNLADWLRRLPTSRPGWAWPRRLPAG